ncbi:MAG: AI-2E family transporter, partial [Blastocatellia bacterium]
RAVWSETRTFVRILLIVLAAATALWMLHALRGVLLLVVLAIFFAYLVAPLVRLVHRPFTIRGRERKTPRAIAIITVYLVILAFVGIALVLLLPRLGEQVTQFAKQAPAYLVTARGRAQKLNALYQRYQLPPTIRETINDTVTQGIETSEKYLTAQMTNAIGWIVYLPWLVLIPVFGFFFLNDAEGFRRSALQILPKGRLRWRADEFFEDVNSTLAAYIRAQLMACVIIGIACAVGFYLMGVPYALALAVIAGFLEFVPLVGPLSAAATVGLVASFHSLTQAFWVLIFLLVLRLVQDYVIYPRLIGRGIHLHPFAIILAVVCGAELGGIAGIFLAIPVVAIVSVGYRHWLEHRGSEGLVAELLAPRVEAGPALAENIELEPAQQV